MKPEFYRQILETKIQILNFMKFLSMGAELFHADRRTDRHDECNNRFSPFWGTRLKMAYKTDKTYEQSGVGL